MRTSILIVEDEEAIRTMLVEILEESGFEVVAVDAAHVGLDALALDLNRFDLVLTDVVMPHVSGSDLCRTMRTQRFSRPIVAMSGDPVQLDRALDAGATVGLTKPFTIDELFKALEHCFSRDRRLEAATGVVSKAGVLN